MKIMALEIAYPEEQKMYEPMYRVGCRKSAYIKKMEEVLKEEKNVCMEEIKKVYQDYADMMDKRRRDYLWKTIEEELGVDRKEFF